MKTQFFLYGIVFTCLFSACDGMYDNVEPYYDRGEINYISKVDSVSTRPGKNRIQFTWKVNADQRIENLYITWNDGANNATFPIDFNQLDEHRYCSVILDSVEEGNHIFYLHHTGKGNMSVATEVEATSYGERYQATLRPREIRSVTMKEGQVLIIWKTIVENCEVKIFYTNISGGVSTRMVYSDEISTVIDDVQPGSPFTYVSIYLPEKDAIDHFSVASETLYFPGQGNNSDKELLFQSGFEPYSKVVSIGTQNADIVGRDMFFFLKKVIGLMTWIIR